MPTLSEVRTRADAYLAGTVWPRILARQNRYKNGIVDHYDYFDEEGIKTGEGQDPEGFPEGGSATAIYSVQPHGNYWQGLITHNLIPSHTDLGDGDSPPDRMHVRPHDVPLSWSALFPEFGGINIPFALRISPYEAPAGHGFVATVYVRYQDTLYAKSQNLGPETWRTVDWRSIDETPGG